MLGFDNEAAARRSGWVRVARWACTAALALGGVAASAQTVSSFTQITWGQAAAQPYRLSEGQGRVVNGRLYSFGGYDTTKATYTPTKRSYVYDPVTNVWTRLADLPFNPKGSTFGGINHAGIATDGTNNIYLASGYTSDPAGTSQVFGTREVWKYVISSNSYVRMPDLPVVVAGGQMEYLGGKLHYFGGTNQARTIDLGSHYVLDLNTSGAGWTASTPLPNGRHHMGSVVYGGKIYAIGGQKGHDTRAVTQNDVHVFDPATNAWSQRADMPVPTGATGRSHISSAVVVYGDNIIVLGGDVNSTMDTAMVSAYSPATNTWRTLTPLPLRRHSGVAAIIGGYLYYTGGSATNVTYKGLPVTQTLGFSPGSITANAAVGGAAQSVYSTLSSSSGTPSTWLSASPAAPWLTLPTSALGSLRFTLNPNGLAAGTYSTTVTAAANGYSSGRLTLTLKVNADSATAQRFNAGGPAYVATDGRRFAQDTYYVGTNRTWAISSGEILNTVDDTMYRTERSAGSFGYRIPVANGNMTVVLHFSENWWGAPGGGVGGTGKRLFHVDIEGARKLTNFDIFAKAGGALKATQESFPVTVNDGVLTIDFTSGSADMPKISAIEVVPAP